MLFNYVSRSLFVHIPWNSPAGARPSTAFGVSGRRAAGDKRADWRGERLPSRTTHTCDRRAGKCHNYALPPARDHAHPPYDLNNIDF